MSSENKVERGGGEKRWGWRERKSQQDRVDHRGQRDNTNNKKPFNHQLPLALQPSLPACGHQEHAHPQVHSVNQYISL